MLQTGQKISRRRFLGTAAVSVVTLSLDEWLSLPEARAQGRPKRSGVGTDAGQKMLALYRKAVAEMTNTERYPHHHPFSWRFQANIHDYPENEPIEKIFNVKGLPPNDRDQVLQHRAIAMGSPGSVRVWRTCSHFGYPEHFLTWHRMYTYFFERIIEKIVGEPFALPYWRLTPDNSKRRMLPRAFREPTIGGTSNPLYFEERNDEFLRNGLDDEDASIVDAWDARSLLGARGFNATINQRPHGMVHVAVGTVKGMGATPLAARDPIFWLHHVNIDRLWESWRQPDAEGRSLRDPSDSQWMARKFAFAGPNGQRIEMTAGDATRARRTLGIEYDLMEKPPLVALGVSEEPEGGAQTTLAEPAKPSVAQIREMGVPVVVSVAPAVAPPVALGFGDRPSTRYRLAIDVEVSSAPGAAYDVLLRVPVSPGSKDRTERLVGSFNLFGIAHADQAKHGPLSATWYADITSLVRQKLVDPTAVSDVVFRARYARPAVPVVVRSVRIEAR